MHEVGSGEGRGGPGGPCSGVLHGQGLLSRGRGGRATPPLTTCTLTPESVGGMGPPQLLSAQWASDSFITHNRAYDYLTLGQGHRYTMCPPATKLHSHRGGLPCFSSLPRGAATVTIDEGGLQVL